MATRRCFTDTVVLVPVRAAFVRPERVPVRTRWTERDIEEATAEYPTHRRETEPKRTMGGIPGRAEVRLDAGAFVSLSPRHS